MVNNPQMVELQKLTKEHFTKETGITVHFTVAPPENDVRDKISQDYSNQAGQYDIATISNFELPFFAENGWLRPLDEYVDADPDFDQQDILPPLRVPPGRCTSCRTSTPVFTITSGGLGTANLPYTVYETFYRAHEYGLASAAGVVVVIGTIIIATFALRVVSSLFREEASRA
ncbi:hypothetical protein SCALM49S_02023 [Streptomyces californicus]